MKRDNYQLRSSEANGIYSNTGVRLNTSSSCIPSVNTVPYRGQIIVYFVSQHCTIWRSDHRVFHLSTQHYMSVRSLCIIPVNTTQHRHRVFRLSTHGGQIIVYSVSQHCTIWRSDHRVFHQWTMYRMVVRSCIPRARFEVVIVVAAMKLLGEYLRWNSKSTVPVFGLQ